MFFYALLSASIFRKKKVKINMENSNLTIWCLAKFWSNWKQTCDGKYRVTLAIGVSTKYVMFFKANKPSKHTEIEISRSDFQGAEQPPIFSISPPPQYCAASTAFYTMHVWLTRCSSGCTATLLSLPPPSPGKTGDEAHDECWAKSEMLFP